MTNHIRKQADHTSHIALKRGSHTVCKPHDYAININGANVVQDNLSSRTTEIAALSDNPEHALTPEQVAFRQALRWVQAQDIQYKRGNGISKKRQVCKLVSKRLKGMGWDIPAYRCIPLYDECKP